MSLGTAWHPLIGTTAKKTYELLGNKRLFDPQHSV